MAAAIQWLHIPTVGSRRDQLLEWRQAAMFDGSNVWGMGAAALARFFMNGDPEHENWNDGDYPTHRVVKDGILTVKVTCQCVAHSWVEGRGCPCPYEVRRRIPWGKGNWEQFGGQSKRLNAHQEPFIQKSANLLPFLESIKLSESEGTSGVVLL